MSRRTVVIPSAARLMSSLRDIGYDLPSAVADLVDNSVDAGAQRVWITVARRGAASFVRIADDGKGMTERVLDEAMRYGTRREYQKTDLGKFGLGLKTASLSQCRRLTVATRTGERGAVRVRRWDLDEVRAADAWELESPLAFDCPPYLLEPFSREARTVVLWEKLDRILGYASPDGDHAMRALESGANAIAEHLSMVFHRFLGGRRAGRRRLEIWFNGDRLRPWDPFATRERATLRLPVQQIPVDSQGAPHYLRVQPYVLPSQVQFSSTEAHAAAAGPKRWNRQQGLYIYRGDRMIQSGGWNRLRTLDEHSKLARIAIDIPQPAEELFQINVAKMRVVLPEAVRPPLRALAAGVAARAQEVYRRRLRSVDDPEGTTTEIEATGGETLGDLWPLIASVVQRELAAHPDLANRVLLGLANAHAPSRRALSSAS